MKKDIQIQYGLRSEDNPIYRASGNKRSFCLTGSPLGNWCKNNEEYLRLTDHENGITVQFSNSSEPLELDYCQVELLRLALKINDPKTTISEIAIKPFSGLDE